MTVKNGTGQACAACKYQRRRCTSECLLAPYFPADDPKTFQSVHRLFGVKHVQHLLKEIHPTQHLATMRSVKYHASMRTKHPVLGCVFELQRIQYEINVVEHELQAVLLQLAFFKQQNNQQHEQQQQQQQPSLVPLNEFVSPFQLGMGAVGQENSSDPSNYSVMTAMPITSPHVSFSNNNIRNQHEYGFEASKVQNDDVDDVPWFQQACRYGNVSNDNNSNSDNMVVPSQWISSCAQEEITQDYNEMHPLLDQIDDRRSNESSKGSI